MTGFLGPDGAGKTTTLRMALGLIDPDQWGTTSNGVPHDALPEPMRQVGAVLGTAFHPARSSRDHLRVYARAAGLPASRADEVLARVGLGPAGRRRAGGYSLGMRQRLRLATALLGDPSVLVLDEPANGLDPEGIQWLRGFLRHLGHDHVRPGRPAQRVAGRAAAGLRAARHPARHPARRPPGRRPSAAPGASSAPPARGADDAPGAVSGDTCATSRMITPGREPRRKVGTRSNDVHRRRRH